MLPLRAWARRCCGDQYHFDMSNQAFAKIADLGAGVTGIYYRQVRMRRQST
jgi:hypothetical protein